MSDSIAQLCQLIVEKLRDKPESSLEELVGDVNEAVTANRDLAAALQATPRLYQDNRDGAQGFQTLVEDGGKFFLGGTHYHNLPDQKKLQDALEAILKNICFPKISPVNFTIYLNSLVNTYEQWWKLYSLTDAIEQIWEPAQEQGLPSPFDFGLNVKTVSNESQHTQYETGSLQDKRHKTERLPVLEGMRKYAGDHVLLVGRPGSGKSTALIRMLLEMATQVLEQGTGQIPILVELRYWNNSVIERIRAFLYQHDPSLSLDDNTLTSLLRQGHILLLMDGLNELPSEIARNHIASFRQDYFNIPMIFATRNLGLGGDLGIERKLEMQPLTEAQMEEFIHAYIPDQAEMMLQQLNERLREFGHTPLLLWMLCEVFQQSPEHKIPSNLAGVFQVFTTMYEDSSVRKHKVALLKGDVKPLSDRRLWKLALQTIASTMMQGETSTEFRVAINRFDIERELSRIFSGENYPVRDILDDLLKFHLLQNRSADEIEFRHQLIQEYYAAEYLLRLLPGLSDDQLKRDYLNLLKWTEPIALLLSLLDKEDQIMRVIRLALNIDLRLGARLSGEVKPDFQELTIGEVMALSVADWIKVELLGKTKSAVASPELLSFLAHPDINIANIAAFYVRNKHSQNAIDTIMSRLKEIDVKFFSQKSWTSSDKTGILWTTHIQALAHLSPQTAIQFLKDRLEHHNSLILMATDAVSIFMELDPEKIIPELLAEFCEAQNEDNRKIAVGWKEPEQEFRSPDFGDMSTSSINRAINQSSETFRFTPSSPEFCRRQKILNILEASPDYHLYISSLINLFENELNEDIQKQIIQILGKSKNREAVHALVKVLHGDSNKLRTASVKKLIELEGIDALLDIEELRILAKDDNPNKSWYAAVVLGHFKDPVALPRILHELENNSSVYIRRTAASILGILGDPECIPHLISVMNNDSDMNVRINAACALSHFGRKEAIPILFLVLKKLTNLYPNSEVVKSLARFGFADELKEIAESRSRCWQRAAIELGKLSRSQEMHNLVVSKYLFDALVEPGHGCTNEIIELMPEFIDAVTVKYLIHALEDPESCTKDVYFVNRVALVLTRCDSEITAKILPTLIDLNRSSDIQQLSWLIPNIQNRCGFYNMI